MADDPSDEIADAMVAFINDDARDYSYLFEAENPDDPSTVLNLSETGEDLRSLEVFIVPVSEARDRIDGCAVNVRYGINVFVSRYLDGRVKRRDLQRLTRDILVSLENVEMADYAWDSSEVLVKYDPEKLATQDRFLSVVTVTYYGIE